MKEVKNKRTKKSAIVATGLAAIIAISGAFAFMSDHDNAINKFSFTDDDGNQSIDIQLTESNWDEASGVSIQYGTPVAKNPVATNIGEKDMYAFATVILPAKGVIVQNTQGQVVDVDGNAITGQAYADMFDTRIVSNVTKSDNAASIVDETEILGVYKDAALANEYDYGETIDADRTDNAEVTVYFKLNADAPYGTAYKEDGTAWDAENDAASDIAYRVLADTVDENNYTSNILGHQFMLKVVPKTGVTLDVRELYTLEVDNNGSADRIIDGAWVHYDDVPTAAAADAGEAYEDTIGNDTVYGRSTYNKTTWKEITDDISQETIYVDGAGRIYSAHVFFWDAALAPDASTDSLFDYVELINLTNGQIFDEDDINIYVETYGLQVSGTEDAVGAKTGTEKGAALWEVLTNSENQEGFDLFGVVKDTQDDELTALAADSKTVANDYGRVA